MRPEPRTVKSSLIFFLLLLVTSIPFWLLGFFVSLPGWLPINLPISALMAFNPMLLAVILTFRESGAEGVRGLFRRVFDFKSIRHKVWYLPIFLIMPLNMLLSYGVMVVTGNAVRDAVVPLLMAPLMFAAFFIAAIGEEVGWAGYAIEPLQARFGALGGSLIVGAVWAGWHVIPFYQAHPDPMWVASQCAVTVGLRVLIVWLCNNNGGSILPAVIFHAMVNVSDFSFPNYGSHYDPFLAAIFTAAMAVLVTYLWGQRTLARYRYA